MLWSQGKEQITHPGDETLELCFWAPRCRAPLGMGYTVFKALQSWVSRGKNLGFLREISVLTLLQKKSFDLAGDKCFLLSFG